MFFHRCSLDSWGDHKHSINYVSVDSSNENILSASEDKTVRIRNYNDKKADAVLAASTFHFGTFSINQVKQYLQEHHIPIRKTY